MNYRPEHAMKALERTPRSRGSIAGGRCSFIVAGSGCIAETMSPPILSFGPVPGVSRWAGYRAAIDVGSRRDLSKVRLLGSKQSTGDDPCPGARGRLDGTTLAPGNRHITWIYPSSISQVATRRRVLIVPAHTR